MDKYQKFRSLSATLALGALVFSGAHARAKNLEVALQDPALWKSTQEQLAGPPFSLLAPETESDIEFFGCKVEKIEPVFAENQLKSLKLQFIGKDDQSLSKDDCDVLLRKLITNLNALTMGKPALMEQGLEIPEQKLMWRSTGNVFIMRYSFRPAMAGIPFQIQYINLEIVPLASSEIAREQKPLPTPAPTPDETRAQNTPIPATTPKGDAPAEMPGDVFLAGIPMIQSGHRSEDWKATLKRVLLYYGNQSAADWIAGLPLFGQGAMTEQLQILSLNSGQLGLRLRPEGKPLDPGQLAGQSPLVQQLIRSYNQLARRHKLALLPSRSVNVATVFREMKPEIFIAAYSQISGFSSSLGKFERAIQQHIDSGVPILWNVFTGLVPETKAPQGRVYGYPRLIIGYNTQTSEVLYSDSLGAGHELKRMGLANALAITMALNGIENSTAATARTKPDFRRPLSVSVGQTPMEIPRVTNHSSSARP